jgi:hypothetical protein
MEAAVNPGRVLFVEADSGLELSLEHWCRMGLLAVAILHWIVFYLLTQSGPDPSPGSGNFSKTRTFDARAVQAVDTRSPAL